MTAPWYIYLVALVFALPIFAMIAVFLLGLIRGLIMWVVGPEAPKPARK